jgi:LPS-assembly protein
MNERRPLRAILLFLALPFVCQAQQSAPWEIHGQNSLSQFQSAGDTNYFSHGAIVSNATAMVTMDSGMADSLTGEVVAQGDVTILDHGHIWRGTNFIYNFKTGAVRSDTFKSQQGAFSLSGAHLAGTSSNDVYTATNAYITTDDYARPGYTIRARRITIALGEYFEAHQATLFWGRTPIFYFPYYKRYLNQHPNNWDFEPGYRSIFGPYLLSTYNWYGNGLLDGSVHFDMREKRGFAGGPDLKLHLGSWGEASFRYYYADDQQPNADGLNAPHLGQNRQRMAFYYEVNPTSNFTAKVVANYQSDPLILRDFFEGEYVTNVAPMSFAEGDQVWSNYTLDAVIQPRLVNFFDTVERLPDVKLTGLRQEVGETPVYYENESSVGYFRREFPDTNSIFYQTNFGLSPLSPDFITPVFPGHDYGAARLDTFHQFTMPETFFGWLNVTPDVGGRLTYYSDVDGLETHTNQQLRAVFNTGIDTSFKASRVYSDVQSSFLDVNELRHIIEPEVDYAYVPAPTRSSSQVPQFDYQSPSLRLLPIQFPDYNDIDAIDGMNVVRFMLSNKLQTKRADGVEDLVNWSLYTDWNLHPTTNHPFGDFYSDLELRPRTWLTFNSSTRYDLVSNRWRDAIERMVIHPSTAWSLALDYRYLINNDPEFQTYLGENLPGHNLISASLYYRMNENWGVHVLEQYEAQYGGLQQQAYSIYRDLRSWTAALMFRVTEGPNQPTDFTVALTFSLKAFPRFGLGSDSDRAQPLFGGDALVDPTDKLDKLDTY